ncbi:flagellar hook-length control protein FliK [Actinoplanes sp. NPDC049265]|uniref:flagellar hook-length control protein FliK n=1 Tax=Actinoplanes sp. NPDC049265 TaxID=3363902 RepID=UPI00371C4F23
MRGAEGASPQGSGGATPRGTEGVGPQAGATVAGAALIDPSATPAGDPGVAQDVPGTLPPPAGFQADLAAQADVTGGVPGITGIAATAPAAPTAPTAPAAPTAPPPHVPMPGSPATQMAMRIAPLRLEADGIHRLTVNLHPADLGPVQVVAEIRNGQINVQLSGSTDAGTDALRNAMDDLRRELEQSGFSNTNLDLRQGPNQQDQARQQFAFLDQGRSGGGASGGGPASTAPADVPDPTPQRPSSDDGRLDIQA